MFPSGYKNVLVATYTMKGEPKRKITVIIVLTVSKIPSSLHSTYDLAHLSVKKELIEKYMVLLTEMLLLKFIINGQ